MKSIQYYALWVMTLALLAVIPDTAIAKNVIYAYTGPGLSIHSNPRAPVTLLRFDDSKTIIGHIELSKPLEASESVFANSDGVSIGPPILDFEFTDGTITATPTNTESWMIELLANDTGDIVFWAFYFYAHNEIVPLAGFHQINTRNRRLHISGNADRAQLIVGPPISGTWTSPSITPIPLPAAFPLFFSALFGLGVMVRKRTS